MRIFNAKPIILQFYEIRANNFKSLYHEALTTTKSSAPKLHDLYMKSISLLKFLITIKQINKFSALSLMNGLLVTRHFVCKDL